MSGSPGASSRIATTSLAIVTAMSLVLAPLLPAEAQAAARTPVALQLGPAEAPPPEATPPPEAAPPPQTTPTPAPAPAPAPGPTPAPAPAPAPDPAPDPTADPSEPDPTQTWATPEPDPAEATLPPAQPAEDPAEAMASLDTERPDFSDDDDDDDDDDTPSNGLAFLITGAAVTAAVGLPLTIVGTRWYIQARNDPSIFSGVDQTLATAVLAFGIAGLAAGAAMLTVGGIKRSRYNAWKNERAFSVAPATGRTARGTQTIGVRVRF